MIPIPDLETLQKIAYETATQSSGRTVIFLDGPMGAGKTLFTQFFVEARGGEPVASPSYAFHHVYETPQGEVDHFDLFRLESEDDLESIGFWDIIAQSQTALIEWADKLDEFSIPKNWSRGLTLIQLRFFVDESTGERFVQKN